MQISRLVLLQICMGLVVYHGSCKSLNIDLKTEDTEALSQLTEEEDTESRVANFLETMKETFLRKLNLSDVPQEKTQISPPQFMMELYNKYASNSMAAPQSDVIRSFMVQDISLNAINGTRSKHRLIFNITIPAHEKITAAELQLLFLPCSKFTSKSFQGTIKVYEMNTTQLLIRRELPSFGNMWETFDVTLLIQNWIKSGHWITGFDIVADRSDCEDFNMSVSIGNNTSAALIVFSDDLGSRQQEAKKELKEMILHEEETILDSDTIWKTKELPNKAIPRRKKRETEYCRRTSLKVNFKEIGWDSWIVAPPEYDAFECRGLCYHPLTDESSPSKHALIQTILNIKNPKKAKMACCVPIKLDPITVMYKENGRLTIRYLYEEMKVAECGCR